MKRKMIFIICFVCIAVIGIGGLTVYSSGNRLEKSRIYAEVDGEIITGEKVDQFLNAYELIERYIGPAEGTIKDKNEMLESLVKTALLKQELDERGIEISAKTVQEINDSVDYPYQLFEELLITGNEQEQLESEKYLALYTEIAKQFGMTLDEYKEFCKEQLINEARAKLLIKEYYGDEQEIFDEAIEQEIDSVLEEGKNFQ